MHTHSSRARTPRGRGMLTPSRLAVNEHTPHAGATASLADRGPLLIAQLGSPHKHAHAHVPQKSIRLFMPPRRDPSPGGDHADEIPTPCPCGRRRGTTTTLSGKLTLPQPSAPLNRRGLRGYTRMPTPERCAPEAPTWANPGVGSVTQQRQD